MKKILGFRTNKLWKKIVASLYYLFLIIIAIMLFGSDSSEEILLYGTKRDVLISKLYDIGCFIIFLIPIIVLELKYYFHLNIKKTILLIIVVIIGWLGFMLLIPAYSSQYQDYKKINKQEEIESLTQISENVEENREEILQNVDVEKNKEDNISLGDTPLIDDGLKDDNIQQEKNNEYSLEIEKNEYVEANLNGHGQSDNGRDEPNYVGIKGYVVVSFNEEYELKKSDDFHSKEWLIPIYEKNNQFYNEVGTIAHKTEVGIISQNLEHKGWGNYDGYLEAEIIETGEVIIIKVENFVTIPYWNLNIEDAAKKGICVAKYHQKSDCYPVDRDGEKVKIDDNTIVLIENYSSKKNTSIQAIVFKDWKLGYGGVDVYFNKDDLTVIY